MIARLTIAALAASLLAGSALALVSRDQSEAPAARNETVIEMNQAWPMTGPLIVEPCKTETCEDI